MKQSFSTSEVARYCHVTADTIRKWAEAGRIVVFKTPGGHRRIRREDLFRFLRQNRIPIHQDLAGPVTSVLVVSEDGVLIQSVRGLFEHSVGAFEVHTASDIYETGRQIAVIRPQVVIVDLQTVGEQGPELCGQIVQSPESTQSTLIAVTRNDDGQVGAQAVERGATAYLRKPVEIEELRQTLAQVGVLSDVD